MIVETTRSGDEPLVSVVIPTHNRAHLVARAISSALSQTHRNLEVIVVDDASTDGTDQVLASFADTRLRVVYGSRRGGSAHARNQGINAARGQFVAFLDSDDEWLPEKVERQVAAFSVPEPPAVVYTGMWSESGGKRSYDVADPEGYAFDRLLMFAGPITTSGIMVSRERVGDELYFDETVTAFEERDLLLRLSRSAHIGRLPEPLYVFHQHTGERISEASRQVVARRRIIEKFATELAQRPTAAGHHFFRLAITQQRVGDAVGMRRSLLAAADSDASDQRLKLLAAAARLGPRSAALGLGAYRALGWMKRVLLPTSHQVRKSRVGRR
jgi:glycosyltransferase involved in cell wall biosynthesis